MLDTKQGLPHRPPYQRLLLARGLLAKAPAIYVVKWYPVLGNRSPEQEWTWMISSPGLSVLSLELNRDALHKKWATLAGACRLSPWMFDSRLKLRSAIHIDPEPEVEVTNGTTNWAPFASTST